MHIGFDRNRYTKGIPGEFMLNISAAFRTPRADFEITVPAQVDFSDEDVFVNVIGRGFTPLTKLHLQSPGRCGIGHEVCVGQGGITRNADGSHSIILEGLDLRPDNGIDVQVRIENVVFTRLGTYLFPISAKMRRDDAWENRTAEAAADAVSTVSDFRRAIPKSRIYNTNTDYCAAAFFWSVAEGAQGLTLLHSMDHGATWKPLRQLPADAASVQVSDLEPDKEHWFCLDVTGGENAGRSNIAKLYSGMYNVRTCENAPTDGRNASEPINKAIEYMHSLGGGAVLFEGGAFSTTTIYLKSNVWLYIDKSAEIHALRGCDDEKPAWYSDEEYRNDQTHMSGAPYLSPDNWMTKQDAGHSYFHNALFFGQRLDNVKIIGNGRIAGQGNLTKSNTVMEQESGNRTDKMVALKLCTNFELGGLTVGRELWYEETGEPNEDQPFYLNEQGENDGRGIDNMLRISNAGHFAMLATGCDGVCTHDVYAEKGPLVRDIFDYMGCNDILAFNVYAEGAPDDVIKLGSDCALGFTRPSRNCIVRNIIGDTSCNLFQIGSETADDIQDVCIDNLYVLGSNKSGFSISVNDGGHIRNIHLNCGGSAGKCRHGITHGNLNIGYDPASVNPHRSVIRRARTPFFISLSNRGRTLGGKAKPCSFIDDIGVPREELMVTNVRIGRIENVFLRNVTIRDVFAASQAKSTTKSRWPAYDGQPRTTPLIVGYKIPDGAGVTMPDGHLQRDIENVLLEDIDMVVKGGNPAGDAENTPRELGVGQFNLRNLAEDDRGSKIPAYGYYVRHVDGFTLRNCTVGFEEADGRYPVVLDDVKKATIEHFAAQTSAQDQIQVKERNSHYV